jgi:hypothetical protein
VEKSVYWLCPYKVSPKQSKSVLDMFYLAQEGFKMLFNQKSDCCWVWSILTCLYETNVDYNQNCLNKKRSIKVEVFVCKNILAILSIELYDILVLGSKQVLRKTLYDLRKDYRQMFDVDKGKSFKLCAKYVMKLT